MRPIFETCQPRDEVLKGELTEDTFAARLKDVLDGRAEPIYQDSATFFDNTYPTEGLRLLLIEALGRVTGQRSGSNAIVRLETAFGGGKTHNLIALYHAAKGAPEARAVVSAELIPPSGMVKVVGVVGSDLDPTRGIPHGDCTTYTLWGELAYQLGGVAGYDMFAESDQRSKAAPGTGVWGELIGDQPAIIMLDEVARHLRTAKAIATGTGRGDLGEQTVAFLMSLLEYAFSQKHVVVVLTLADSFDAFGRETDELKQELSEARRVSARQERVITPTGEPEIAAIVTHRLFRNVDQAAAQEIADAYQSTFVRLTDQGTDLPQDVSRAEYASGIRQSYPFHPELLNALNRKVSTIPNFQKTRGALRLLAAVVRQLWDQRPAGAILIHPFHIDLSVAQISEDLTSRLVRPAFQQVIEADIVSPLLGSPSHAQSIDSNWVAFGKPPYASRVATTIFLHSLTQGTASGLPLAELMLATVQPQDDPTLITKAIERLVDSCWFLDYDGRNFRFKTEPALNKIVADEMALVGKMKAKAELDGRIRQIWKKGALQPVYFPVEAADVDDDAGPPKLVIIHYDAAAVTVATSAPPDMVRKLAERTGSLEGYRTYRNNVLFLVADQGQLERMVEVAQRHLAFARIVGDAGRMSEFNREQRDKLKDMQKTSELEVRVAITRTYSHFYYPSADAPQSHASLSHEVLPPQDQGDIDRDQSQVVLRMLRQLDKVITADTPDVAPTYVRAKAWDAGQPSMSAEDLRRAFAKRMSLRILLDINQLKKTIRSGIQHDVWVYYDTIEQLGYNAMVPPPSPQISDDVLLYLPDEARRQGLKMKGDKAAEPEATCPVCHHPISQCTCDDDHIDSEGGNGGSSSGGSSSRGNRGSGPAVKVIRLHAEGAPAQAFQAIVDQCGDQGVGSISRLVVMIEGAGKAGASDIRALGLIIPQMGKGQFQLEQSLGAEFGPGEQLSVSFKGGWDRYKRLKTVTEAFSGEASKLTVRTTLRADFAEPLEANGSQFQTIRDVFGSMDMGRLVLEAEPAKHPV